MIRVRTETFTSFEGADKRRSTMRTELRREFGGKEEDGWKVRIKRRVDGTFDVVGFRVETDAELLAIAEAAKKAAPEVEVTADDA